MLRRFSGSPVASENFVFADVRTGNLGPEQALPVAPDLDWSPDRPHTRRDVGGSPDRRHDKPLQTDEQRVSVRAYFKRDSSAACG